LVFSDLRTALRNTTTQDEAVKTAYNSSQQELEELRAAASKSARRLRKARRRPGAH
jgi:hypothetical protein